MRSFSIIVTHRLPPVKIFQFILAQGLIRKRPRKFINHLGLVLSYRLLQTPFIQFLPGTVRPQALICSMQIVQVFQFIPRDGIARKQFPVLAVEGIMRRRFQSLIIDLFFFPVSLIQMITAPANAPANIVMIAFMIRSIIDRHSTVVSSLISCIHSCIRT